VRTKVILLLDGRDQGLQVFGAAPYL
jgi:hypothetical protein